MKVTDVRLRKIQTDGRMKALALNKAELDST